MQSKQTRAQKPEEITNISTDCTASQLLGDNQGGVTGKIDFRWYTYALLTSPNIKTSP